MAGDGRHPTMNGRQKRSRTVLCVGTTCANGEIPYEKGEPVKKRRLLTLANYGTDCYNVPIAEYKKVNVPYCSCSQNCIASDMEYTASLPGKPLSTSTGVPVNGYHMSSEEQSVADTVNCGIRVILDINMDSAAKRYPVLLARRYDLTKNHGDAIKQHMKYAKRCNDHISMRCGTCCGTDRNKPFVKTPCCNMTVCCECCKTAGSIYANHFQHILPRCVVCNVLQGAVFKENTRAVGNVGTYASYFREYVMNNSSALKFLNEQD